MKKYKKLIFVCEENTCRSIMAEAIFNQLKREREISVISRGLVVLFPEPINPKAVAVLKSSQIEVERENSIELTWEDIEEDTLILAMTEAEVHMVTKKFGKIADVSTLRAFTGQSGDIVEPHGALTEYGILYEHLDLLVKVVAEILNKNQEDGE